MAHVRLTIKFFFKKQGKPRLYLKTWAAELLLHCLIGNICRQESLHKGNPRNWFRTDF